MKTKSFPPTGRFAGFCLTFFLSAAFFIVSPEIPAETVAPPPQGRLANRAAFVTGAGSGMDERIALMPAKEEAKAVADIDGSSPRKMALFPPSGNASCVKGSVLAVDSGWSACREQSGISPDLHRQKAYRANAWTFKS